MSSAKVKLTDLLRILEEEGVVGEEAEAAVERFVAMRDRSKGGALAKRQADEPPARFSAQQELARGRPSVEYGEETAEEAKRRWLEQEMEDPDGLLQGGATAGGIFGDSAIPLEGFDPGARRRAAEMQHLQASTREKVVMVRVLTALAGRLGIPADDLQDLLGEGDRPAGRRKLPGRGA